MNGLDWTAALFAMAACAFFGLRGQMLKPEMTSWPESPRCVRWANWGMSVVHGGYVWWLVDGHDATPTETFLLTCTALYSGLLWVNLLRQLTPRRPLGT